MSDGSGSSVELGEAFEVGLGAEYSDTSFESIFDRSNSGTAPVLELRYRGPLFYLELETAWRDLEPAGPTSTFVPFNDLTGQLEIGLDQSESWRLGVYSRRNLVYSIQSLGGYFLEQVYGASFGLPLGRRFTLGLYGEFGDHQYAIEPGTDLPRDDELTSWGGSRGLLPGIWRFPGARRRAERSRIESPWIRHPDLLPRIHLPLRRDRLAVAEAS